MSASSALVNPTSPDCTEPGAKHSAGLPTRRALLASTAMLPVARAASARTLAGGAGMPWRPFAGDPPQSVKPGPWVFFTPRKGPRSRLWSIG